MGFITILAYSLLALGQRRLLLAANPKLTRLWWSIAWLSIFSHAYLLHHWIDTIHGQNLSFFYVLSQIIWLSALILVLAMNWYRPAASLGFVIFPLAAISIIFAIVFPSNNVSFISYHPKQIWHILLALTVCSVLGIAGIQSILLAAGDWLLRHKRTMRFMRLLPPLETMEIGLFRTIAVGFVLLTLLLVSSVWWFNDIRVGMLGNSHKMLLTLLVWLIFAILLWGRYYWQWHGRVAIRWTLSGVGTLMLLLFLSTVLPKTF